NPPANRFTLIRCLSFDLTGPPPSAKAVRAFISDPAPTKVAYANLVEDLLKSSHYSEYQARNWLDAARDGDTHGLHLDNYREMWLYRDWVINAFSINITFDQFTVKQISR
ncbi:DUF1549 domain-containing protein, partial [Verrucomicrobiales bacterium]|nr:DUF1549 domain-containing protein [Verrucomicrobiales bacterium]